MENANQNCLKESARLPLRNTMQIIKNILMQKKQERYKVPTECWKLANKKLDTRISWCINGKCKCTTPIQEDAVCDCTKNWK